MKYDYPDIKTVQVYEMFSLTKWNYEPPFLWLLSGVYHAFDQTIWLAVHAQ